MLHSRLLVRPLASLVGSWSRPGACMYSLAAAEADEYLRSNNIKILGGKLDIIANTFADIPELPAPLRRRLESLYPEPTPIQAIGWPTALSGRDMVGLAHTGTGKTLAFLLPAYIHVQKMRAASTSKKTPFPVSPKVLIIAPTRELVNQIHSVAASLTEFSAINSAVLYGGTSVRGQLSSMLRSHAQSPVEIIIATPGRLIDIMENQPHILELAGVSYLVLDEADRMLDMGFEPQLRQIIPHIPTSKPFVDASAHARPDSPVPIQRLQTLMWSATWPQEVRALAGDYLRDHVVVRVGSEELSTAPNVQQSFEFLPLAQRTQRVLELLPQWRSEGPCKTIIFCATKLDCDVLGHQLSENKIRCAVIHGDKSQNFREDVLARFRNSGSAVLIATDVAARGIDVVDVTHVVNLKMPTNLEDYVHRVGRTARAGALGTSLSFIDTNDSEVVGKICDMLARTGKEVPGELLTVRALPKLDLSKRRRMRSSNANSRFNDSFSSAQSNRKFNIDDLFDPKNSDSSFHHKEDFGASRSRVHDGGRFNSRSSDRSFGRSSDRSYSPRSSDRSYPPRSSDRSGYKSNRNDDYSQSPRASRRVDIDTVR